jgi:hypothetical protein
MRYLEKMECKIFLSLFWETSSDYLYRLEMWWSGISFRDVAGRRLYSPVLFTMSFFCNRGTLKQLGVQSEPDPLIIRISGSNLPIEGLLKPMSNLWSRDSKIYTCI